MTINAQLRAWQHARNTVPEDQLYASDAFHAEAIGLPTLAALCRVLMRVQEARGPMAPREIESELRGVLSVAVGEGTARLRHLFADPEHDGVPGIPTLPHILLESRGDDEE